MIDVLWSVACVIIGVLIYPLVMPLVDDAMRYLKSRRRP